MLHLNFTVVFLYTVLFEKLRIVGGKTSVKKRKITQCDRDLISRSLKSSNSDGNENVSIKEKVKRVVLLCEIKRQECFLPLLDDSLEFISKRVRQHLK